MSVIISNPRAVKYFADHVDIDPNESVELLINILELFNDSIVNKMSAGIHQKILDKLTEQSKLINSLNSDITNTLFSKMVDIKRDYLDGTKLLLLEHSGEHIAKLIDKSNETLIDKTNIILHDIIPKNNEMIFNNINNRINALQIALRNETDKLTNAGDIKTYLDNFEQKFALLIQPIEDNINNMSEVTKTSCVAQDQLANSVQKFLNTYNNSTAQKGAFDENRLSCVMNEMFPSAEFEYTGNIAGQGDFRLKRSNKAQIMIENKSHTSNVPKHEVQKFIDDVCRIQTHGIMLSQRSGICDKNNYEISVHGKYVLVYLHNVNYTKEKIQSAIDIIDRLAPKLAENEQCPITEEMLIQFNNEFSNYITNCDKMTQIMKQNYQLQVDQFKLIRLPLLDNFFATHYASSRQSICGKYVCGTCQKAFDAAAQLSAHKKIHVNEEKKRKRAILNNNDSV